MYKFIFILAVLFSNIGFSQKKSTINKWTDLLDKNLSNWDIYQGYKHQVGYNGTVPKTETGDSIPPIGYNINKNNTFSVIQENNENILKVTGEYYGAVITKNEYENYHLKLKVKWGKIKWDPRKDKLFDAGIVYHSQGPGGADYWRAWMLGEEMQLMEGHFGDYWNIANSAIDVRAFKGEGSMNPVANVHQPFLALGVGTGYSGFCLRSDDYEKPKDQWTEVELVCFNGKVLHIVEGHVVMVLQNPRYFDNKEFHPLIKGKIQLQSEACEVFYKDIKIKELDKFPAVFNNYFK